MHANRVRSVAAGTINSDKNNLDYKIEQGGEKDALIVKSVQNLSVLQTHLGRRQDLVCISETGGVRN